MEMGKDFSILNGNGEGFLEDKKKQEVIHKDIYMLSTDLSTSLSTGFIKEAYHMQEGDP